MRTNCLAWMSRCVVVLSMVGGACSDESMVAKIGKRRVDKDEFAAYLQHRRIDTRDSKRLNAALDEYVERAALAQAIEQEKLLDPLAVQVALEEQKKELLIGRYFEKLLADRVGDDAVRNYYDSHEQEYAERKVHVAHILVRTTDKMSDEERTARLTRIQEAHAKLRAGAPFDQVAATYSEDRISAPRAGDLGWIKQGAIDPRISELAFKTKLGEVTEPFLSQFGYHVLKVLEGPEVIKRPFEAVAGDIRYQLRHNAKEAEIKRLSSAVSVQKKPEVLETLKKSDAPEKAAKLSAQR
jgi:peptidyl-prolyl cis-trans isomerase C